jgi:hypothetical protein
MQKSNTVLANLLAESEYYKKGRFSCANPFLSTVVSKHSTYNFDTFATRHAMLIPIFSNEPDRVFVVHGAHLCFGVELCTE